MRVIIEFIILLLGSMVAKSVISSVMKGMGAAAANAYQQQQPPQAQAKETTRTGELHKDPVCGTYVSEATSFRRQLSGKTIYYCSDACREKHAL
jgi:YHS domain-containing protein